MSHQYICIWKTIGSRDVHYTSINVVLWKYLNPSRLVRSVTKSFDCLSLSYLEYFDLRKSPINIKNLSGKMNGRKSQLFNGIFTDRVELLPQTPYLLNLMTHLRDQNTKGAEYVRTVDRIARQLIPQGTHIVPWICSAFTDLFMQRWIVYLHRSWRLQLLPDPITVE